MKLPKYWVLIILMPENRRFYCGRYHVILCLVFTGVETVIETDFILLPYRCVKPMKIRRYEMKINEWFQNKKENTGMHMSETRYLIGKKKVGKKWLNFG